MNVLKNNGVLEPLDIEKIEQSLYWATYGVDKTCISDILMNSRLHFYEGIPTTEILDVLINTSRNMADLRNINYDVVAKNLYLQKIYKQVFNGVTPKPLRQMLHINIDKGLYRSELISEYTNEELLDLEQYIKYSRNFNFSMAGLEQLYDKYVIYHNNKPIEDPQTMFMAIAMDVFLYYVPVGDNKHRIDYIKFMYDALSTFKISLPTPEMKALRTYNTDYASCVALRIGDSVDSWAEGKTAIMKHTVASAGIGVDISSIASTGDLVKHGMIKHAGKIPIMRAIDSDIQMCTQNGRRGQAVTYVNAFDPEIESILALKSPRTEVNKRINDLKHGIKFNRYIYELIVTGQDIHLLSVRQAPAVYEAFDSGDIDTFIRVYNEHKHLAKKVINGRAFLGLFSSERFENGIYYVLNIDHANNNKSYKEPIHQSNICVEFLSPTKAVSETRRDKPDIGICVLSNVNQGLVGIDELPEITKLLVFAQNSIIGRQNHPMQQSNEFVRQYASLGIGFSNHAYWMAKQGLRFGSTEAIDKLDEWCEAFQYGLLRASCDYSMAYGKAPKFSETTYADGIMPFDRVNRISKRQLTQDWSKLRNDIIIHGLANCALSMVPPSETSSVTGGQTNCIDPIKNLLTIKDSKTTKIKQFAPDALNLADKYDYAYDTKDLTSRYLHNVAVVQNWIDQSVSAGTFYNPELYPDKKVPIKQIMFDILLAHKLGIKTLYYNNCMVEDSTIQYDACVGGGCSV